MERHAVTYPERIPQIAAARDRVTARILAAHAARCATVETWQSVERDQTGRKFTASWVGCRACHVAMLATDAADVEHMLTLGGKAS